jgi:hypothetical protein
MDLERAASLLESELADLPWMPEWRRRDLDNAARASIRAMREAAETLMRLEGHTPERGSPQ